MDRARAGADAAKPPFPRPPRPARLLAALVLAACCCAGPEAGQREAPAPAPVAAPAADAPAAHAETVRHAPPAAASATAATAPGGEAEAAAGPTNSPAAGAPAPAAAAALPPGHAAVVRPAAEARLRVRIEPAPGGDAVDVDLAAGGGAEAALDQRLEVEGVAFTLRRFLPELLIQESIEAAPDGAAGFVALHLVIQAGPASKWAGWLVPGSPILGRAVSSLALVEILPAAGIFDLVETEKFLKRLYDPEPKLLFEDRRSGRREILPVRPGETLAPSLPGYTLRVERFLKRFAMDLKTGAAMDHPDGLWNPALEVRIDNRGAARTAWLFSNLPEFSQGGEDRDAALRFVYPLPPPHRQRPLLTLVDADSGPLALFACAGGEYQRLALPELSAVELGELEILAAHRLRSARIVQKTQTGAGGLPAAQIVWSDNGRTEERWLPLGVPQELRAGARVFVARLMSSAAGGGASPHRP
jgi:hypothetical protein